MTDNTNPQPAAQDNVTLTDLQNVLVVIDLASSRGAFRGNELQPVGILYEKIGKFLQSVMPKKTEETETESSTTTTSGSEVSTDGEAQ